MRHATYHPEQIRRATILPTFTQDLASVHFHPHADFASLQVFTCDRLSCVLTKEACAANYTRTDAPISCKGCPIGVAHAGGQRYRNEPGIHTASELAMGLSCVRCEKSARTNARLIGRMRLVRSATLCVSCFNRQREIEKFRAGCGGNSKGGVPRKWAHLQEATITIEDAAGKRKTLDIGLRQDYLECARYAERAHPGATLIETAIGGEIISQFSLWTPLPFSPWEPGMVRDEKPSKPKRTYIHRGTPRTSKKTNAVASPVDWDDWDTPLYKLGKPVESDESDADSSRQARRCGWLPPMSEEDDEAYRQSFEEPALDPESIAAYWDLTADGLAEFVEWLTDGWPVPVIEVGSEAKPSLSGLAKAHGISAALAHYRLRTRGAVEFPLDPNGSVLHTRNTSCINGVHWAVKRNKWYARGYQAGHAVHLGYFDTIEDAAAARAAFDNKPAEPSAPVADAVAPNTAHEPVSAPVRDPIAEAISKLEATEEVRPLTRKERREYARLETKIAKKQLRAAEQTAKHMPATKAKATAIASRALAIFDSMGAQAGK